MTLLFSRRFLGLILVPLFSVGVAFAGTPESDEAKARREFLFRLGFNDVVQEIQGRLDRREYTHELNRRQMVNNIVAYEVLNASRELSILILDNTNVDHLQSQRQNELVLFAAKMLALKPLAPATDYPTDILKIKDEGARETALVEWLHDERIRQMNIQKTRILSDLTKVVFGNKVDQNAATIKRFDKLLTTIVERMYMDDTIGNGRYFGRALTALLVREEKLRGGRSSRISKDLSAELRSRYNLYLENFIGDTMILPTQRGEEKYKVENGTMMLTRNLSAGSLQISWAAIPKNLISRWKARFKGIIGTPIAGPLFVNPEDTENGISLWMRIRDRLAQGGILRMGYSHIVFYEVKEDAETGIKMPRVIDNYPNRVFDTSPDYVRTGGARFTYPEQVIDLSHHAAVFFASPTAEKTAAWSKENLTENGYQKEFFPSIELELDGLIPVKNDRIANWRTTISESEFKELHSEKNAEKLHKSIWKKYAEGLEEAVYDGWTFHWPDPYDFYVVSSTYCSQLGDMVMRKYVGMPLERNKSRWHWILSFMANVGKVGTELKSWGLSKIGDALLNLPSVKQSMKVTNMDIISPTSLVLQPFMEGESFLFGSKSPEQRVQSVYMADDYREVDMRLTEELEQKLSVIRYDGHKTDTILDYGAAMRDFEYGTVMRASRGVKTHGFSVEKMAELASEKAGPQVLKAQKQAECDAELAKRAKGEEPEPKLYD